MTVRASQAYADCFEVPIEELVISAPGYPEITIYGAAVVSHPYDPDGSSIEIMAYGYTDAHGDWIEVDVRGQDGFKQTVHAAMRAWAERTNVRYLFQDAFWAMDSERSPRRPTLQQEYGTYGRSP